MNRQQLAHKVNNANEIYFTLLLAQVTGKSETCLRPKNLLPNIMYKDNVCEQTCSNFNTTTPKEEVIDINYEKTTMHAYI